MVIIYMSMEKSDNQCTEPPNTSGGSTPSKQRDKAPSNSSTVSESADEKSSCGKRKHRAQRYRTAWEDEPEFSSWLMKCRTDQTSAYCKACTSKIQPRIASIKQHSRGQKHQKKLKTFDDTLKVHNSLSFDDMFRENDQDMAHSSQAIVESPSIEADLREIGSKRTKSESYYEDQMQNNNSLQKINDNYSIFGEYVANELRNLSSEFLKRKLKRLIQKSVLEVSEEEELMIAKSSENMAAPEMYTYILTEDGENLPKGVVACQKTQGILYETGAQ